MLMLDFDQVTGIEVKHKSGCSQATVKHKYEIRYINNARDFDYLTNIHDFNYIMDAGTGLY